MRSEKEQPQNVMPQASMTGRALSCFAVAITIFAFGSFLLFCLRSILGAALDSSWPNLIMIIAAGLAMGTACAFRPAIALHVFACAIPFMSWLEISGLMDANFSRYVFAWMFILWLPQFLRRSGRQLAKSSLIEVLIDLLACLVVVSAFMRFQGTSVIFALWTFWLTPVTGQLDPFHTLDGATVLLQGLFFLRMLLLEEQARDGKLVVKTLAFVSLSLLLFSCLQLVAGFPQRPGYFIGFSINSPFQDKNSYGSVVALLACYFAVLAARERQHRRLNGGLALGLVLFLTFSNSMIALIGSGTVTLARFCWSRSRAFTLWAAFSLAGAIVAINVLPGVEYLEELVPPLRHHLSVVLVRNYSSQSNIMSRILFYRRALSMIEGYPLTGVGIGSFYGLSVPFQDKTTRSWYSQWAKSTGNSDQLASAPENAHNYFLQFAAELGLPALLLLLAILILAYRRHGKESAPWRDGIATGLAAYLITMLSGHPLLLGEQQFLFWFCVAALVVRSSMPPLAWLRRRDQLTAGIALSAILLLQVPGYAAYVSSQRPSEDGLYAMEDTPFGPMRWMSSWAKLTARTSPGTLLSLSTKSFPDNLGGRDGLVLTILEDGRTLDTVHYYSSEVRELLYYLPGDEQNRPLELRVNQTFVPRRRGSGNDSRSLGLMIGTAESKPLDSIDHFGFLAWEALPDDVGQFEGERPTRFHWSGKQAGQALSEEDRRNGVKFLVRAVHPGISRRPVLLTIATDRREIRRETLADSTWRFMRIDASDLDAASWLFIAVDRTWNPKASGKSADTRDLGVAVAPLEAK